ncbi:MAG: hypothetical protein C4519_26275 [Desulfobacteraceae bacterium]|nr:MAG: hypothetical protein C4519_26275 [Desulfobacteraceae bacterium]
MEKKTLYNEGHLFVAAIRVLERRHGAPPTLEQISELVHFSTEQTGLISRRLRDAGIVEQVEGAYGDRWGIADHLKLEDLPRDMDVTQLDTALKKFQSERNKLAQKVESIKGLQAQKRKDLFAGLEKKLKQDLSKD